VQLKTFSLKLTNHKRIVFSGETFLWGRIQMTYEAIDDDSNSQFCNFNIYVQCK